MAPSPRSDTVDPFRSDTHDPGPLPEAGSLASSRPLLAEPFTENESTIESPSSENFACLG